MIVLWVAGAHFAVPVETKAYFVQLFAVSCNVLVGCDGRVLSCLNGILLGRQSVSVVSHWV